jgi:hypothetical protein
LADVLLSVFELGAWVFLGPDDGETEAPAWTFVLDSLSSTTKRGGTTGSTVEDAVEGVVEDAVEDAVEEAKESEVDAGN